jgi:RNA polymerase sigma-70 factor (ECF subfamily)
MQSTGKTLPSAGAKQNAGGTSDAALVQRVKQGERSAFDLLVAKYQHKILNLVMRYVKDPSEAMDVAQEAFF